MGGKKYRILITWLTGLTVTPDGPSLEILGVALAKSEGTTATVKELLGKNPQTLRNFAEENKALWFTK